MSIELNTSVNTTELRTNGGWCKVDLTYIRVHGPDANRFLQAQTTNDVNQLAIGDSQTSCLIDRKSRPVGIFQIYKKADDFGIICDTSQSNAILEHLEKFKFADKVNFVAASARFLAIQGPKSRSAVKDVLDGVPPRDFFQKDIAEGKVEKADVGIFKLSFTGEEGFVLLVEENKVELVAKRLSASASALGMAALNEQVLNVARIEAGIPKLGVDFNDDNLLAETTLDEIAVSYTKGCFQGQEVLARIRGQGAPTRAIVGLQIEPAQTNSFDLDSEINFEGETIGWIKSNCNSEFLKKFIALAIVKRDYRAPGKTREVTISGKKVKASVELLPFYKAESPSELAKKLYEEALAIFAKEDESTQSGDVQSIKFLKEALNLDPLFEDAYESLGVILNRHGQLDEAIELMEYLAKLNPDSVMAHTNLSVFYVEKGWKEKAEDEKAISMSIRMKMAAAEMSKAKQDEEQRKALEKETLQRMDMFKQVLEIDAEDQLANYGLGDCLVNLEKFAEAVPHLKKSISGKPMHTVSYLVLGKAYEGLKQLDDARKTYELGIDVAARRGDGEPMKKMLDRLEELKS